MKKSRTYCLTLLSVLSLVLALSCRKEQPKSGIVQDEALRVGRPASSFPAADEDYFHDMDGGVALTPDEIKGRNTWIVWTGGNDRFWDNISISSFGSFDVLKTITSYQSSRGPISRANRFKELGLINEPCFQAAKGPDPQHWGLWLDQRQSDCPPDPFADQKKYPGVAIGARGKNLSVGSYYGEPTGIVGLRLFPNPDFDETAARNWNPVRYREDPSYYLSKNLVRPYRVGMSCGFCHVGPNPIKPPADPENPKWENLSSNVGAQYFWVDRIWSWNADPSNFIYQLLHTSNPGSLDTSLVSTDYINNPRTMNAIYNLHGRLEIAKRWGKETLSGGSLDNKQFNHYVKNGPLTEFFQSPDTVWTPHVLKDGSDSVGALGALNRVYVNIGLFSEEWTQHFNPLVGGKRTTPFEIAVARRNSSYWGATEAQTPDMALFFLKSATPHHLRDAPEGMAYLTNDRAVLTRGKEVFAERCARCHSSKAPAPAEGMDPNGCAGTGYLGCWNRYWNWTKSDDYKRKMREIVMRDDFLDDNFLSADFRVPVTLLQTNACSPLATNAIAGNIWDNFSSKSYKDLPSVGTITVYQPITGQPRSYKMPAGGRGYTRPASLVSVWSTAPYLLDNSVGKFVGQPSVDGRMQSFQDSIEKMLWPEKRDKDPRLGDKIPGVIQRTTARSYLWMPTSYLPDLLQPLVSPLSRYLPGIFGEDGVEIGPIPKDTPVDLLANLELVSEDPDLGVRVAHDARLAQLVLKIKHDLVNVSADMTDDQAAQNFADLVEPLFALSKCPDYVVSRGHYFGTDYFKEEPGLSDSDKRALIEFLKTF
jgi:hypothetical protein